jgi:hypothetical protein
MSDSLPHRESQCHSRSRCAGSLNSELPLWLMSVLRLAWR